MQLQQRLAGVRDAKVFLPALRDLPEFMKQSEFQHRFGGVGQPPYRKMVEQIEARIAALPLYAPEIPSRWLRRYARSVSSANTGAVFLD